MSPSHRRGPDRRGPEDAGWRMLVEVLLVVGVTGTAVYVVGLLMGWW